LTETRDCKHSPKYLSDNLRIPVSINSFFHRRLKKSLSHIAHYKEPRILMNKTCIIIAPTANKTKFNMVELNQLLLEFEAHLNGDAVTEEWKKPRDSWMSEVSAAIDEKQLGKLLVELEANFQNQAVQSYWKMIRQGWVEECHIASTLEEVSSLLLELESNTTWEVMTDEWQQNREKWVQQMYQFIE
jgi:hypothetical protein